MSVNVNAYVDQPTYNDLKQHAFKQSVSKSAIIQVALDQLLVRWADDPASIESDLQQVLREPEAVSVRYAVNPIEATNWRGRRLLVCQAADSFRAAVQHINDHDGKFALDHVPPPVSESMKNEMINLVHVLLRMVLVANDGQISDSRLNAF